MSVLKESRIATPKLKMLAFGACCCAFVACHGDKPSAEGDGGGDAGGPTVTPFEVLLESHGAPAWTLEGFQFFAAPLGDAADNYAALTDTLNGLLADGHHSYDPNFEVIVPGEAHVLSYAGEWPAAVSAAGFVHTSTFLEDQLQAPSGIFLAVTLVPTSEGSNPAPSGPSADGADGLLLENALFPITVDGEISRAGQIVDGTPGGSFPSPLSFVPALPGDGLSHLPMIFAEQKSFFTVAVDTPGLYEWRARFLDRNGLGWTASIPFTVNAPVVVSDGGTDAGDGGGVVVDKPCREGGPCEPNRYSDLDQGAYATGAYQNMLLRGGTGQFSSSNHNGEIVHVGGFANGEALRYWLMSRVSDQGKLVDLLGGNGLTIGRLYQLVDSSGAALGDPILEVAPDSGSFSPLVQEFEVEAMPGYTPEGLKSATTLRFAKRDPKTGFLVRGTNRLRVVWPVDSTVSMQDGPVAGGPKRMTAWYERQQVELYSVPGSNADGSLAATDSTDPDNAPPVPTLGELWQFRGAGGAPCGGGNVASARLGSAGYSPLVELHLSSAPDCTGVPKDAGSVQLGISAGTFSVTDTFYALLPQKP